MPLLNALILDAAARSAAAGFSFGEVPQLVQWCQAALCSFREQRRRAALPPHVQVLLSDGTLATLRALMLRHEAKRGSAAVAFLRTCRRT
jgi:hypothetical protein